MQGKLTTSELEAVVASRKADDVGMCILSILVGADFELLTFADGYVLDLLSDHAESLLPATRNSSNYDSQLPTLPTSPRATFSPFSQHHFRELRM